MCATLPNTWHRGQEFWFIILNCDEIICARFRGIVCISFSTHFDITSTNAANATIVAFLHRALSFTDLVPDICHHTLVAKCKGFIKQWPLEMGHAQLLLKLNSSYILHRTNISFTFGIVSRRPQQFNYLKYYSDYLLNMQQQAIGWIAQCLVWAVGVLHLYTLCVRSFRTYGYNYVIKSIYFPNSRPEHL